MKRFAFAISMLMAVITLPQAIYSGVPVPHDLPTIEALINLHKKIKKDEDKAMKRIGESEAINNSTAETVDQYNKIKKTLYSKYQGAYSYYMFAATIADTAEDLYCLIKEYEDFTKSIYNHAEDKPVIVFFYASTNNKLVKEVKHIGELYTSIGASQINLVRSSMEERMKLLMVLKDAIANARHLIRGAYWKCYLVWHGYEKVNYFKLFAEDDLSKGYIEKLKEKWKKHK